MIILLLCVLILLFIILSAFFSSAEITYAKANRFRVEKAAEEGSKTAKLELHIIDHYVRSLSAILVGNNLANIASSSAATMLFARALHLPNGAAIASVVMTALLLIFGETLPKIVASSIPDALPRLFAYPMKITMLVFKPVVDVVEKLVHHFEPLWTPKEEAPDMTTEELVELVDNIEEEGVFTEEDLDLVREVKPDIAVVSNHGGRIETRTGSTAEFLMQYGEELRSVCGQVWVDGGIRSPLDVATAMALGAKQVMIGRPVITALCKGGTDAVVALAQELKSRPA